MHLLDISVTFKAASFYLFSSAITNAPLMLASGLCGYTIDLIWTKLETARCLVNYTTMTCAKQTQVALCNSGDYWKHSWTVSNGPFSFTWIWAVQLVAYERCAEHKSILPFPKTYINAFSFPLLWERCWSCPPPPPKLEKYGLSMTPRSCAI